jgi:ElaB/YqjD/DUF883 family membrane-anchored ribosome-binding protein
MATTNGESLSELERRAETTRAELAQTVDALHSRVSPTALKADMMETIETRIRENPLQTMALAVGVAYPLWRIVGRIPAPVLLIGAGLAMARRGSSSGNGYYAGEAYRSSSADGQGTMATLKEKAASLTQQVSDKAHEAMGKAHEAIDKVRGYASDKTAAASDMISDRVESGRETASDTVEQVSETYQRTRENLADMIERHPMVAGGIALAVGALLASSIPVSRQENRVMGSAAGAVRQRTRGMAQEGFEQAKTAARDVYRQTAAEVREQGLSPDVARHAARTAMDTARNAVEQTVDSGAARDPMRNPT